MKASKLTAIVSAFLMLLTTAATPVHAEGDEITIIDNVGMGNVSITLVEEQINPVTKKVEPFEQNRIILPGDTVSKIVYIKNEGEPAWIRAKVDFSTKAKVNLKESDCTFAKEWIRCEDGYWYWPHEVKQGESVKWLESFKVPAEWTEKETSKTQFHVNVHADAVQTRHFEPNFKAKDPWFGTVIEKSIYNYTRPDKHTNMNYAVWYEGGAEGLVSLGGDFFSNWETLMPGDHLTGSAVIRNSYSRKIKMYFRSENQNVTDLEKHTNLKIYRGEECIFDGKLADAKQESVLAILDPGVEFIFKYELDVPEELNNAYDLSEGQVNWIFRVELLGSYSKDGRKTGVDNDMLPYYIGGGVALIVICGALVYLKKKKKDEKTAA